MTFWDFASGHPFEATVVVIFVVLLLRSVSYRVARTLCIRKHGWPTYPVDADGDVNVAAGTKNPAIPKDRGNAF